MLKNFTFYGIFVPSTMLRCVLQSIKIDQTFIQKTALKSMLRLRSILEPTWLHFGRVLGAKMGPSRFQMALDIDPKANQKHANLLNAFKTEFS